MAVTVRSMPYRLDQGPVGSLSDLQTLPSLFANADYMFQTLFEDLKRVAASAGATAAFPLTKVNDTNVTLTLGGLPAVALLAAASLTLGWTGTLAVARGGIGVGTLTAHGVLLGQGTSAITATAVGATNTLLHGNTGADPSYSAVVEADITLADNTTDNVTTARHGFAPKAPNDVTKFLDGTGAYSVPAGTTTPDWSATATATVDQSVTNSATLVNETELVLALVSGKTYIVEFYILYSGNNTNADYRWQFSCPIADIPSAVGFVYGGDVVDTGVYSPVASPGAVGVWPQSVVASHGTDGVDGIRSFFGRFTLTTNANANLQFMFANGTAGVGRVSKTRTGSLIRVKQLN